MTHVEKSQLLNKILNDYIESNPELLANNPDLTNFCNFAVDWIAERNFVGIRQDASGLYFRFGDSTEAQFLPAPKFDDLANTPYVSFATPPKRSESLPDARNFYPITGNG